MPRRAPRANPRTQSCVASTWRIVAVSIFLTFRYAGRFAKRIGHQGMIIVLRLSAFIVLSIGVQIAWNGIKALLAEVGVRAG